MLLAAEPGGGWMGDVAAAAGKLWSGCSISFSAKITLVIAALASASGAAALIADFGPIPWTSEPGPKDIATASFDARFFPGSAPDLPSTNYLVPLVQSLPSELEIKFQEAKGRLTQRLQTQGWRADLTEEPKSPVAATVPLPRPRPAEADLDSKNAPATAQQDNRTLLQKLSDLFPARYMLASLDPDGGFFRGGPDPTSLGYDNLTAVYDISARVVYMPNGLKLEAHSGYGHLMDDPGHVSERNVGATPPAVYDLRPRERLFHGVEAIRMIPVDGNATLGRSGLLAHSYLLGPNGDSNGCVSIKNYEMFLRAFKNGEIKRLVVVPSLNDAVLASPRSNSQS
jgi:Protein of unknown function (DUF2778)